MSTDRVAVTPNLAKQRLRAGQPTIGFGVSLLRGAVAPQIAKSAAYHWLSIDGEHGSFTVGEMSQLCAVCLPVGITPMVRVRAPALHEAARALDNGAQGVIAPNVHSADEARHLVEELRYAPMGRRNWGASGIQFGYDIPPVAQAQAQMEEEILLVAMIESDKGVANAAEIAAVPGIDLLFIGGIDLSLELGIPSQFGTRAWRKPSKPCGRLPRQRQVPRHGR